MPLGASFGKSNNKGSTAGTDNTVSNANFNTSPTNPQWVTDLATSLGSHINALQGTDPTSYVANATPLLQTAANSAGDLTGDPWAYAGASDVTRGLANAKTPDIAGNVSKFMDPYLSSVVNATSADLDHSDGLARAQDNLDLAGSGAFGGSGAALTKAATEDALSRARATTLGGLRSHGFDTALGGATNQAGLEEQNRGLRLGAASQLATIADQAQTQQRANIAAQTAAAQPIQAIDQAKAQAPLDFQSFLSQLFAGTLPQLFQGQTGTEDQTGTETTTGTSKGTGTKFGLGWQAGG
jgi:hypothetical protein